MNTNEEALKKRLANTEKALLALWSLIQYTYPPEIASAVDDMMEEYAIANDKLGASFEVKDKYFEE